MPCPMASEGKGEGGRGEICEKSPPWLCPLSQGGTVWLHRIHSMKLSGLARLQRARWVAAWEEASPASFGLWITLEGGDFPGPSLELRLVHTGLGFPNTALLLGTWKAKLSLKCCFSQARNYPLLTRYWGYLSRGQCLSYIGLPRGQWPGKEGRTLRVMT